MLNETITSQRKGKYRAYRMICEFSYWKESPGMLPVLFNITMKAMIEPVIFVKFAQGDR